MLNKLFHQNLVNDFKDIVVQAFETFRTVSTSTATSKFQDSDQTDVCRAFHDVRFIQDPGGFFFFFFKTESRRGY